MVADEFSLRDDGVLFGLGLGSSIAVFLNQYCFAGNNMQHPQDIRSFSHEAKDAK
jgi:hypothetical protein